jgi:hypothetical protein
MLAMFAALAALASCNSSSAAEAGETVDPRFASAEALVEHYNALTTVAPVKIEPLFEMMYAESELQRRFLAVMQDFFTVGDLMNDAATRFDAEIDTPAFAVEIAPQGAASITEHTGDRALATFKDERGRDETLYLVKIENRWWLSGYTIEYDPETKSMTDNIRLIESMSNLMTKVTPDLRRRLDNGEFGTMDEFQLAMQVAMMGYVMQHPDEFQHLRDMDPRTLGRMFRR